MEPGPNRYGVPHDGIAGISVANATTDVGYPGSVPNRTAKRVALRLRRRTARIARALSRAAAAATDTRRAKQYAKARTGQVLEAIETIANGWIAEHPEFHAELADLDAALRTMQDTTDGKTNPFLHLSMHVSISEQCSIDQPRGIRQAVELLAHRRNALHGAHHDAMECLGQMLWESQRAGRPPDGDVYVACVQRHATRD